MALLGLQCVIVVFPDHTHLLVLLLVKLYTNRLENLVQLSNAESHAVEMKPFHGIDNAIAKRGFGQMCQKKWICIFP